MPTYPHTPDGRYFIVKETLWRCSNPGLSEATRQALVSDLMRARRAVKQAKAEDDMSALQRARASVHAAKVALGSAERFGGLMAAQTTTDTRSPARPARNGSPR